MRNNPKPCNAHGHSVFSPWGRFSRRQRHGAAFFVLLLLLLLLHGATARHFIREGLGLFRQGPRPQQFSQYKMLHLQQALRGPSWGRPAPAPGPPPELRSFRAAPGPAPRPQPSGERRGPARPGPGRCKGRAEARRDGAISARPGRGRRQAWGLPPGVGRCAPPASPSAAGGLQRRRGASRAAVPPLPLPTPR